MLEWQLELEHDWNLRTGAFGRGLERLLRPDLWQDLARTYVGVEPEENWSALFALAELFGRAASEVADGLGFADPVDLHRRMLALLDGMRSVELT